MTTLGIVLLAHTALHRVEQVARFWASAGCPVVLHVDAAVSAKAFDRLKSALGDLEGVSFSDRQRCRWGTWSLVDATQKAAALLLRDYPRVRHICLMSGSCLPIRPAVDLVQFLDDHPSTDFIESTACQNGAWAVSGLEEERFTLRFPFSWQNQRWWFDRAVEFQRALGLSRRIPPGVTPHLGSQWWCLTRQTLSAILDNPRRAEMDRYFRGVWIPDESYFQTLARIWSRDLESRSLTLAKFDDQGKPFVFYDDHLHMLRRSDCFLARKVWPGAERLYGAFLSETGSCHPRQGKDPSRIDRILTRATERRVLGRKGKVNQGRFPLGAAASTPTAARYCILHGFGAVFQGFETWLARETTAAVHGHVFAKDHVGLRASDGVGPGGLSCDVAIRDADLSCYLSNLIWNTRGTRQVILSGPDDHPGLAKMLGQDPNADVFMVSGAWVLPLLDMNLDMAQLCARAVQLQRREDAQIAQLTAPDVRARVRIWRLADLLNMPMDPIQQILERLGASGRPKIGEAPHMVPMHGLSRFLQNLRNQGMEPHLVGDVSATDRVLAPVTANPVPVLVKK